MDEAPGALILLSGGLDSAVTARVAASLGYRRHGLTFSYGQRHAVEIARAEALARDMDFDSHRICHLEPFGVGSSALTDLAIPVPRHRGDEEISGGAIPETYVPARNTIFLAHALAWCESLEIYDIFLGVNALDYSGYPDCRPEYLRAFEDLAQLATRAGVEGRGRIRLQSPLLHRTKAEIVRLGAELGVDFAKTWSCYSPVPIRGRDGEFSACGACDSCQLRHRGFREAGIADPTNYAAAPPRDALEVDDYDVE